MSKLIRGITSDGLISVMAVDSTDMAAAAEQIHKTSAVVTAGLGRLLTAASMMGAALKNADGNVTLRVKGDGPVGSMLAVGDSFGNVRGYAAEPIVELPLNAAGKLDVGGAVGAGMLSVSKDLGMGEPYNGMTPLVSGEIADDIAAYFAQSEQIPTVCALGVLVSPDLTVKKAGGYLIQLLPAAGEDTIMLLEEGLKGLKSVTEMLDSGLSPLDMVKKVLKNFTVEVLSEYDCAYVCNCSRKRVERVLIGMGKEELENLAKEQQTAEVNCHFCEKAYTFTEEELLSLTNKM